MTSHLLRIEVVNLASFLLDSSDLSTVRGASLIALDAAKLNAFADENAKAGDGVRVDGTALQPVSVGASVGLYQFASEKPEAVAESIREQLDRDPIYRHATIVVTTRPLDEEHYQTGNEQNVARGRWQQLQQPTVTVRDNVDNWRGIVDSASARDHAQAVSGEGVAESVKNLHACSVDHLRPARDWLEGPAKSVIPVSDCTAIRKSVGRSQKQRFYRDLFQSLDLAPNSVPAHFAIDFEQIGEVRPKLTAAHGDITRLDRKLAVLYLDGNDFGKKGRKHCQNPDLHRLWDRALQQSRGIVMADFFDSIDDDNHSFWHASDGGRQRLQLETLLWGGDEVMWVMPAWQGWSFVAKFFHQWHFPPAMPKGPDGSPPPKLPKAITKEKLSHGGGIVFCNYKTPIHRINSLVRELADTVKQIKDGGNKIDGIAYEVLESFDHTGDDLAEHRRQRTPPGKKPEATPGRPRQQQRQIAPNRANRDLGQVRNLDRPARQSQQPDPADAPETKASTDSLRDLSRLVLTPAQVSAVDSVCRLAKSSPDFPFRRLRANVLNALTAEPDATVHQQRASELTKQLTKNLAPEKQSQLKEALEGFAGDGVLMWHHVCELWDYAGLSIHSGGDWR